MDVIHFTHGTPASSTTETGRHDIAEILLKVALSTNKINQSNPRRTASKQMQLYQRNICVTGD
jgi:hypothetical protein